MKAIIFARVSSREQEETGYSLSSQEKLLTEYAQQNSFEITKLFSISESASGHSQRTTFTAMLEFAKKSDVSAIIVEKVDRLTRSIKHGVMVNEWIDGNPTRQVHFVKENCVLSKESKCNEKFIWNIKVTVAQYYIDNLSEEVKKGHKEKIAQGWRPTKPPLGYVTIGDTGHKTHIPDLNIVPFIKSMFELYATGNYPLRSWKRVRSYTTSR